MEILILLAVPVALVWGLVFYTKHADSKANLIPLVGLLVVLVGSVFGAEFLSLPGGPIPVTLDRLLLVGLVALYALFWLRGTENLPNFNRTDITIVVLMIVVAASTVTHDFQFRDNMPASRLLFFYFVPFAIYLVVRSSRMEIVDLKWISLVLGALGVYLALTAVCETRGLTSFVFPRFIMNSAETEFLGRGRGPFLNPVSNGIFMVVSLCSIWMWWPNGNQRVKTVIVFVTPILLAGIFSTLTRSVWVSCLASITLFIWYPASRQVKGLCIIAATVVAIIAFPVIGEKVVSFKRDKEVTQAEMEQSAALRPLFAIVAWNMFQDRPIFGCGFGQYARAKYPYLQDPYSGRPLSKTKYFMQHNVFLAYLTETGLIGVLVLIAMLIQMTGISWSLWKDLHLDLWARLFGLLMLVLLANFFINGMFHDVSISPMVNTLLFFMFGLCNNIHSAAHRFDGVRISRRVAADSLPAIVRPRLTVK